MSEWTKNLLKLSRSVAYESGRLVARHAIHGEARRNLSWAVDTFFEGIHDELDAAGVSRKVAADMFGVSYRTYQRRVASLSTLGVGRTTWTILHSRLMNPQNRETILGWFSSSRAQEIASLLSDMVRNEWLTLEDDLYTAAPFTDEWDDNALDVYLAIGQVPEDRLDAELLAEHTGVAAERWADALARYDPNAPKTHTPTRDEAIFAAMHHIWHHAVGLMHRQPGYQLGFWVIPEAADRVERLEKELIAVRDDLAERFQDLEGHDFIPPGSKVFSWMLSFGPHTSPEE